MLDKKRKSSSKEGERPSKKQQVTSGVHVRHIVGPNTVKPVVAISPGVGFPDVTFCSFAQSSGTKTNLILQSSEHSTLNYTAREDDNSIETHLKHYIAVFDPESGKLQVTEAKRMTVRSTLRTADPIRDESEDENVPATNYTSRAALTEAFGTKKSKKAVQSATENRLLAQGNEGADNPISNALLSNMAEDDNLRDGMSPADALSNKPLPPANLATNEIDQVYSLDTLIVPDPTATTLEIMPIGTWIAKISEKREVKTRCRFVANRVGYLAQQHLSAEGGSIPKLKRALQVLRYIELMLDIHKYVMGLPRHKSIPPFDKWPEKTMSFGTPLTCIRPIMNRFFPDGKRKDHSLTLLRTTILALALHIPPPGKLETGQLIVEPTDIAMDMFIDAGEAKKLYRELGCLVRPPTDSELTRWGLERRGKKQKAETGLALPKANFAILKLPLSFPKMSRGRQTGRR